MTSGPLAAVLALVTVSCAGAAAAPSALEMRNVMNVDLTAIPGCDLKPLGRLATKPASAIAASPFSVGCETLDRGMWSFDKALPHIAALGAKWARVQTGWGKCEREKGVYDFAWLDAIVDRLLAAGVQPWFNVGYGNRLYLPGAPHETAVGWTPVRDAAAREGWARFTAALARHYRGRVQWYEVWNEPDIKAFWTPYDPSPDDYADLVALTSRAIRGANPEAKIIGGAMAGALGAHGLAFAERCFELGMGKEIDAFSYHLYQPTPDTAYPRQLAALRAVVERHRPGLPLWQGESGAPSKAQAGQALSNYEWDEAKQAKWFLRRSVTDLALDTPLISIFHASDFEFYIVKDQIVPKQYYFGLIGAPEYRPKPAYYAVQSLCTLFAGQVRRVEDVKVEGAKQAYAFETEHGPLIATWEPHDMMLPFEPGRTTLTISGVSLREPVLIDPAGQRVYSLTATKAGESLRLDVPLTDWPLLIGERGKVPLGPAEETK